jgi:Acetyltransferase (GNAT) domain
MIEVEVLAAGEEHAWDSFLLTQPAALVHYSIRYRDLLVDHLNCQAEYLVALDGGEIRGVLPILWASDSDGRVANALPFYGSHGSPIAESRESENALIEAWNDRVTDPTTLAGTMVMNPMLERDPVVPRYDMIDERISQVTRLPDVGAESAIMEMISRAARKNVRKAHRLGVSVKRDADAFPELCEIHQENMRAIGGLAKSPEFFATVPRHLRAGKEFDLWTARWEGETIGASLVLRFNRAAEYFTSGTALEHRDKNPHAAILIAAMAHAARRGCRIWNFGGTWLDQQGVYRFKRKWGTGERRYHYFTKLNDRSLLESTAGELRARFPHFYVVPFTALNSERPNAAAAR